MTSSRILILAGLGAVALGGTAAGVLGVTGQGPLRAERISLALPPPLDLVAFDGEETVIDTTFGPAMPQAAQLTVEDDEAALRAPPQMAADNEPPKPEASPVPKVEGPVPAPSAQPAISEPALSAPSMSASAPAAVQGLRVGSTGDKTRIIIDLTASTDFAYSVGKDGKTVSVVLPGASWKAAAKGATKAGGRITGYAYEPVDGGSKVTLMASEPVEVVQVEPHSGNGSQGYQLVVDLVDAQGAQARRGGMVFWTTKETPPKLAEADPLPLPEPKVAAAAVKTEPPPMADYRKARDWSGFYAGLQTGYDIARAKEEHSVRGAKTRNVRGPEGGVFLGWGHQTGALYLGAELEGAFSGAAAKEKVSNGKHEVSKSWNYGGAVRVGTPVFDNGLIYLKGGYQASAFKLASNRPDDVSAPSVNRSKTLHGPMIGIGYDHMISENWFLRADASYVFYNAMKYTDSAGDTGKITPRDIGLRLGVAYKFN
jgi:outer membrane immunogenic protein